MPNGFVAGQAGEHAHAGAIGHPASAPAANGHTHPADAVADAALMGYSVGGDWMRAIWEALRLPPEAGSGRLIAAVREAVRDAEEAGRRELARIYDRPAPSR